jgi:type VI secretion system protein ImpH
MASSSWNPDTAVALEADFAGELSAEDRDHLLGFERVRAMMRDEIFRFEFFQAVRLLERMETDRKPVGYFVPPASEAIRFASLASLSFPPSQLYSLDREDGGRLRLVVQFMGLCASITILPNAYTEYLLLQIRNKDLAMRDFFDIFNHRMISLFYRGWEKYRFFVGVEASHADGLSPRLMDFLGLGTTGLQDRNEIPDRALIAYSGLLGRHTKSPGSLKQILEDYFEVPVTIEQFAGTWRSLPPGNRTIFGGPNRASQQLGLGAVVGDEVWEHHGRIRIRIGPLDFDDYRSFLPGPGAYNDLKAWVRYFSSGQFEAEVQLILKRNDVPQCALGLRGREESRLGLVSWLKTKPIAVDPGDAVFLLV